MQITTATLLLAAFLVIGTSVAHTPPRRRPPPRVSAGVSDVDVLNFALNLEYLEANFYSCAAYGKPLSADDRGNGPEPTGCKRASLSPEASEIAAAIADDEIAHVKLLRAALGAAAVPQPEIDIGAAFEAAANAAFGLTPANALNPAFDAYANDILFYHAAFIFEDVGVTAYKYAAPLIASKDYLSAAAGILAVEAYHGGAIRAKLLQIQDLTVFPYATKVSAIVDAISALRATVSGAADDKGILTKNGNYVLAPSDANAVAFGRSPAQVLKIVYLGGTTSGGFFPKGLNGSIK